MSNRQDIDNPEYWKQRLVRAKKKGEIHKSIYECTEDQWKLIKVKHQQVLNRVILPNESILDAGCGYGRLLSLLPKSWSGDYLGIDLSEDFVDMASDSYPDKTFLVGPLEIVLPSVGRNIRSYIGPGPEGIKFDWCVLVSIKDMIIKNNGQEAWDTLEVELRKVCARLLLLEYDENDEGTVE